MASGGNPEFALAGRNCCMPTVFGRFFIFFKLFIYFLSKPPICMSSVNIGCIYMLPLLLVFCINDLTCICYGAKLCLK